MEKKTKKFNISQYLFLFAGPAFVAIILIMLLSGIKDIKTVNSIEEQKLLESSLQHAIVNCYALEGFYPSSIEYLRERYGLTFDDSSYSIHYNIFANNVMPEVTVVPLRQE